MDKEEKHFINARTVLWYFVFSGLGVSFMFRININIAIVDMVQSLKMSHDSSLHTKNHQCHNTTIIIQTGNESMLDHISYDVNQPHTKLVEFSVERYILDQLEIKYEKNGFIWDEYVQNNVFGSFFWLHWATQIPGGILARRYGTKLVFGVSLFIGSVLCSAIPILAFVNVNFVMAIRLLQGFVSGFATPSLNQLTAHWIPPNERSKFMTAYLGSSLGVAGCYPLFGYIISISSWEYVFHASTLIGVLWCIAWYYLIFDTPAKHPRIDPIEKDYIEKSLGTSVNTNKTGPIPWKHILTDIGFWTTVATEFGGIWGITTMMTQTPTYYTNILGFEVTSIGLITGLPYIVRMIFAFSFSIIADRLLKSKKVSRNAMRKFAGFLCNVAHGLMILAFAFTGCNFILSIVFCTLGLMFHGAISAGPLANIVDMSPNFSSILYGINGVVGNLPGFLTSIVVGYLTFENQTLAQWRLVFIIAALILISTGMFYVLCSDSTLRSWNDTSTQVDKNKSINLNGLERNRTIEKFSVINDYQ